MTWRAIVEAAHKVRPLFANHTAGACVERSDGNASGFEVRHVTRECGVDVVEQVVCACVVAANRDLTEILALDEPSRLTRCQVANNAVVVLVEDFRASAIGADCCAATTATNAYRPI